MNNKTKPPKKGFFGMLLESFKKTGGCCCGPGETCGGSEKTSVKPARKETTSIQSDEPKPR